MGFALPPWWLSLWVWGFLDQADVAPVESSRGSLKVSFGACSRLWAYDGQPEVRVEKPTCRDRSAYPNLDYFRFADSPLADHSIPQSAHVYLQGANGPTYIFGVPRCGGAHARSDGFTYSTGSSLDRQFLIQGIKGLGSRLVASDCPSLLARLSVSIRWNVLQPHCWPGATSGYAIVFGSAVRRLHLQPALLQNSDRGASVR
jgi:hypothetical protein